MSVPEGAQSILQFLPPMPLTLFARLLQGISDACESEGYEAFFLEEDGYGRVWCRPKENDAPA